MRAILISSVLAGVFALDGASQQLRSLNDQADVTRDDLTQLENDRAETLEQLQALERAEDTVIKDLGALEERLIAAAMASQRREEQATASERKLISLEADLSATRQKLISEEQSLEMVMASLAVTGRHRPPALVTKPHDANTAIRAAILMAKTAPRVQASTDTLVDDIADIRRKQKQVLREQDRLVAAETALAATEAEILDLTSRKRAAFEDVTRDAQRLRDRAALLGREADTVRELLAALERQAPPAPALKPRLQYAALSPNTASLPKPTPRAPVPTIALNNKLGGLTRPAAGDVVLRWGDRMPGGTKSEGITIATRAAAQVSAPVDGKIEFAGPFRTYGQLLIISTSDGYHVLVSGMAKNYVAVGQTVRAGEAVAQMVNRADPAPELYLEVRKGGKPMDPAKWIKSG